MITDFLLGWWFIWGPALWIIMGIFITRFARKNLGFPNDAPIVAIVGWPFIVLIFVGWLANSVADWLTRHKEK